MPVPDARLRALIDRDPNSDGAYVLYWMTAYRRTRANDALDRAIELAHEYDRPLVILEGLRAGYRWASDRIHKFVLDGMADNRASLEEKPVTYLAYVEPEPGAGSGLLAALAERAVAVIGDDWPGFFHPKMLAAAAEQLEVRFEVVDACGLVPFRAADKVYKRAVDFRRYIQKNAETIVAHSPKLRPFSKALPEGAELPRGLEERWPMATDEVLSGATLADLPIDHDVGVVDLEGGSSAARTRWRAFRDERLVDYAEGRNHPDDDRSSGLSPYLHFGHIGTHEIFGEIVKREAWTPANLGRPNASKTGFWGMSEGAEAFLDELVTWRELCHHTAFFVDDHDAFESLPDWAKETIDQHREDPREVASYESLEKGETDDDIWNAAQRELVETGRMHNYLRMLWGKKIYEWSPTPERALEIMIELNNKYAIDGRDPNSYGGIFWVLGRYDRAWGPEREVFGKLRYMSSDSTRRKLRLKGYLDRFA